MESKYLSIVAASRNDNHGGNMLQRMQIFLDLLAYQTDSHRIPSELVLVHQRFCGGAITKIPELLLRGVTVIASVEAGRGFYEFDGIRIFQDFRELEHILTTNTGEIKGRGPIHRDLEKERKFLALTLPQ